MHSEEWRKNWKRPEIDTSLPVWISPWGWKVIDPANLILGNCIDIGSYTVLLCQCGIEIDDDVQIGPLCAILSESTIDNKKGKVRLCRNAGVGSHCTIMPGVTIGENSIVGAHSFVRRSIPPDEVWAGTPARFIRYISSH